MPYITVDEELLTRMADDPAAFSGFDILQIYNGLDVCLTDQIREALVPQMEPQHWMIYERSLRVQSLCLAMTAEGMPTDPVALLELACTMESEIEELKVIWRRYLAAIGCHTEVNPNSPPQIQHLFFNVLKVPETRKYDPKRRASVVTTDRKALEEKIALYPVAAPFVACILAIRERAKMAGVFRRGVESDGRLRCSFHPAGTETGRLASSQNVFSRGTNAQNITERLRHVVSSAAIVRQTGSGKRRRKIMVSDLEQAESRAVAYISGDANYIAACEGGDLHTTVCRMVWSYLPWNGDLKHDKKIAEEPFYRTYSYRDMAKRGGHGTNYYGKPPTIAKHMKVDVGLVQGFQIAYFSGFPGIPDWHKETILKIQKDRKLVSAMGRERCFWGRPDDEATYREAIAYDPQSSVADIMNEGLCQTAAWIKAEKIDCRILAQIHDAGMFMYWEDEEEWLIPELLKRLSYPTPVLGLDGVERTLVIPLEAKVGWNWGYENTVPERGKLNPLGLRKWKPGYVEDRDVDRLQKPRLQRLLDVVI